MHLLLKANCVASRTTASGASFNNFIQTIFAIWNGAFFFCRVRYLRRYLIVLSVCWGFFDYLHCRYCETSWEQKGLNFYHHRRPNNSSRGNRGGDAVRWTGYKPTTTSGPSKAATWIIATARDKATTPRSNSNRRRSPPYSIRVKHNTQVSNQVTVNAAW